MNNDGICRTGHWHQLAWEVVVSHLYNSPGQAGWALNTWWSCGCPWALLRLFYGNAFPPYCSHSLLKEGERIKDWGEEKSFSLCNRDTKNKVRKGACWRVSLSFGHWSVLTSNLLSSLRSPKSSIVTSLFTHPKSSKPSGDFLSGFNIKKYQQMKQTKRQPSALLF